MIIPVRAFCLLGLPLWRSDEAREAFASVMHQSLPHGSDVKATPEFFGFMNMLTQMICLGEPPQVFVSDGHAWREGEVQPIFSDDFKRMMHGGYGFEFIEQEVLPIGLDTLSGYTVYKYKVRHPLDPLYS
ncbi:MAG: hypothetical protein AAB519_02850 [Patescibacteria group bacterium]